MDRPDKENIFQEYQRYYSGFFIDRPVGNNAFSFEERAGKRIYVPELIRGDIRDVCAGENMAFSEVDAGEEKNVTGLRHFVYWRRDGKDIFIFDNHNHAFAFWVFGLLTGEMACGSQLIHVDQHKDMRSPERYLEPEFWKTRSVPEICGYVNEELNVGNFIKPAIRCGIFEDVVMVDSDQAFEQKVPDRCVADIDMDIFSPDMDYIPLKKRLDFIRKLIDQSSFITIATSPYFVEQERAINMLKELF